MQTLEGLVGAGAADGHIGVGVEQIDLAHLAARQSRLAGQGAENIAGADLGLAAAIDAEGDHLRGQLGLGAALDALQRQPVKTLA